MRQNNNKEPEQKETHSAGGIILNNNNEIVIVEQRGNVWSLPKGHIEPEEDPLTAAKREIHEETGLRNITLIKELGTYTRYKIGLDGKDDHSEKKHITLFLFRTSETTLKPTDPNHPQAIWIEKKEIKNYITHPKDCAFIKKQFEK